MERQTDNIFSHVTEKGKNCNCYITARQQSGKGNVFSCVYPSAILFTGRKPTHSEQDSARTTTPLDMFNLDLTAQGPAPGHVRTCSLQSMDCRKAGG